MRAPSSSPTTATTSCTCSRCHLWWRVLSSRTPCCGPRISSARVARLSIRGFELFLRWREEELRAWWTASFAALADNGMLQPNEERSAWMRRRRIHRRPCSSRCWPRAASRPSSVTTSPSRCSSGPAAASSPQKALEQDCQLAAQRINMLYGFNSPSSSIAACSRISSTCCVNVAWSGLAPAAISNSTRCWCASRRTRSSCCPSRYDTASCRSPACSGPGIRQLADDPRLAFPSEAAAILARNMSVPGRPRGEASSAAIQRRFGQAVSLLMPRHS